MSEWWSSTDDDEDGAEPSAGATDPANSSPPVDGAGPWDSTAPQPPDEGVAFGPPVAGTPPDPAAGQAYQPVDFAALGQPTADVGTVAPSKRPEWKSPVLLGGVVAGALVLIMGGWTAFQFFGGGGAGSPEEVLTKMAEAVNAQDPVLAATVVDPDELPMLVELMTEFEGVRERTGLGGSGPVAGTELMVDRLELEVDELAPNVARVVLTDGELSASYDLADAPATVQTFMDDDDREQRGSGTVSVDDYEDEVGAELSAIVVKKGRGWYISPSMTTADLLIESQNGSSYRSGDFDEYGEVDFFAEGAESPEKVLDELSDAVASGDPEAITAQLPSDQGQVAVVFQDAIDQLWEENLYSNGRSGTFDRNRWKLGRPKTHTEKGPNGTTRLVIDSGDAKAIDDYGDAYDVSSDGWELCGKASGEERECFNLLTGKTDDDAGWGADAPVARLYGEVFGEAPSVLVRKADGGWKLDPVATVLDLGVSMMRQIDQDYLQAATLQPIGQPNAEMKPDEDEIEITFDDTGFASVAVATEPDEIYSVVVDDVDPVSFGISNPQEFASDGDYYVDSRYYLDGYSSDVDDADVVTRIFVASQDTTVLGFGGLANTLDAATVRVVKVEVGNGKTDEEVQGTLSSPIAMYSVPTDSDMTYELEFAASKDATIEVIDGNEEVGIKELDGYYSDYLASSSSNNDAASESFVAYSSKSLVIVRGEPGTSFSFRISEMPQGFDGGSLTTTVTVPGGDSIQVPFDVGGGFSYVDATVRWNENADIDPTLYIDGNEEDWQTSTQYTCPCSEYLSGSGSTGGYIRLKNYDSFSVTVQLELSIE